MTYLSKDAIPVENAPGFYVNPMCNKFAVNREGKVITLPDLLPAHLKINQGYLYMGYNIALSVHRAMALLFIEPLPGYTVDELYVNHIDSNRSNNVISNLEWVTPRGNVIHSLKAGQRPDNNKVECKDLETGEIKEYFSIRECARNIHVNGANLHKYLTVLDRNKCVIADKYVVKYSREEKWPNPPKECMYTGLYIADWIVYDPENKYIYIHGNKRSAAARVGITETKFIELYRNARLNDSTEFEINGFHCMPFIDHKTIRSNIGKIIDIRKQDLKAKAGTKPRVPIIVENLLTKEVKEWPSSQEFVDTVLHVDKKTFQRHLLRNNGVWKKLYKVTYLKNRSPVTE